jgi:outer membrane protein TolC
VWDWNFGDDAVSDLQNPEHVYEDTGYFAVTLIVTNEFGCTDTIIDTVRIEPESAIYIPNAFTPDGDGVNESWGVKHHGLTDFERIDINMVQPLYTFGKITSGLKAATHGVNAKKAMVTQEETDIVLKTKEYYYGLLLAREIRKIILDVKEDFDIAKDKINDLLEKGSENVDEADLHKLDTYYGEVEGHLQEVEKSIGLAHSALRMHVGLSNDIDFDIAETSLKQVDREIGEISLHIEKAKEMRPEFTQIKEGLLAHESLVKVAKGDYYPSIFLGGLISYANSSGRTRIKNPYINDEFNHLYGGVVVGAKWDIDFGITKAKVESAFAEELKLTKTMDFAEAGIPLQVKKAYLEAVEAKENIISTERSYKSAKKWLVIAVANFDMGIGPAKEIFEALSAYARMNVEYFKSIYNYNMALANLSHVTGEDCEEIKEIRR